MPSLLKHPLISVFAAAALAYQGSKTDRSMREQHDELRSEVNVHIFAMTAYLLDIKKTCDRTLDEVSGLKDKTADHESRLKS